MADGRPYREETRRVPFGGKSAAVRNMTPALPEPERKRAEGRINRALYAVFSKYRRAPPREEAENGRKGAGG